MILSELKICLNLMKAIKRYNEESDEGYLIEADIQHLQNLYNLHSDLPFLPERMKIEKFKKLVANLHDKTDYVIYIRNLKQALNYGLVFKKVHRVIEFNQKFVLKQYIGVNCELRKEAKNDFEKDLFKLVNTSVFAKTMENI